MCRRSVRRQAPGGPAGLPGRELEGAPQNAIAPEPAGDDLRRGRDDPREVSGDRGGQCVPARMADRSAQRDGAGIEQSGRGGQAQCDAMCIGLQQRRGACDLRLGVCRTELVREGVQCL